MGTQRVIPFWGRVKELMKAHKITQNSFARYINVNYNTFKYWICYGLFPDACTACDIAEALGVSVEYLVRGADGKSTKERNEKTLKRKNAAAQIKKMALQIEKKAGIMD
jgi:transcriptional regulator with XRE-family HTH domain